MKTIEKLLLEQKLVLPEVEVYHDGLGAINVSLCVPDFLAKY
jgi:hypothetical protein